MYPVFISIKNPLILEDRIENGRRVDLEVLARESLGLDRKATSKQLREAAVEKGHDGVIYQVSEHGYKEYVAFNPTQIKSATSNTGAFSPTDPRIQHSRALPQTATKAFKDWFGASKITKGGQPHILYHGTQDPHFLKTKEYPWIFDTNRDPNQASSPLAGLGIFLGDDTIATAHAGWEGTVHPFYVRMENPYTTTAAALAKKVEASGAQTFRKRLQELNGHDGIIIKDRGHVIAFDKNQVKSATDNTGAFSRTNDDVRLSISKRISPIFDKFRRQPNNEQYQDPKNPLLLNEDPRVDHPLKAALRGGLGLYESATDRLRRSKNPMLTDLANAVDRFFNREAERRGLVNGRVRPFVKKMQKGDIKTLEQYFRHWDNGRKKEATALIADNANLKELAQTVKDLFSEMGDINRRVGVEVYDDRMAKRDGIVIGRVETKDNRRVVVDRGKVLGTVNDMQKMGGHIEVGGWRLVGKVKAGEFWPRALRPEVSRVMQNPTVDPVLWNQLADSLIDAGWISNRDEAQGFLTKKFANKDGVKNDYHAQIENARNEKLPEMFYDYSWDGFQRYSYKWASRTSQVEFFGQGKDKFNPDLFDKVEGEVLDQTTKNYITELSNRVYNQRPLDIYHTVMDHLNILATAIQLGNPGTAVLNLIGGSTLTTQLVGWKKSARAYRELVKNWEAIQQEAVELGILDKDILRILRDNEAGDAYLSAAGQSREKLAKFAEFTMKWGGYTPTENIIRSHAFVAGKLQLSDALQAWNKSPNSAKAKKYTKFVQDMQIDRNKLLAENGKGEETAAFLRKMVNMPQGSYRVDQVPLYVDTPMGRFLFKYQKFATQVSRMFWRTQLKPFVDAVRNKDSAAALEGFRSNLRFFATAAVGGSLVLLARGGLFGYADPGPDEDEIREALKNDDTAYMWTLIFSRAYHSILAAGGFGFFGNYIQMSLDVADQQRVKNPLEPPGLASLDAVVELTRRGLEQGKLSARDLEQVGGQAFAFYRGYKRLGASVADFAGIDLKESQLEMKRRENMEVRQLARRYADQMDITSRRTSTGRLGRTELSPLNQSIYEALILGDAQTARRRYVDAMRKAKTPEERKRIRASVQASMRIRQPIQIGGKTPNAVEMQRFLQWARTTLPPSKVALVENANRDYIRTMRAAGL